MRPILEMLVTVDAVPWLRQKGPLHKLRRIAVIAVNARSAPNVDWDRNETPPGMVTQLLQSASVPIDHYSYESLDLVNDIVARWNVERDLAVARARLQGASEAEAEANVPRLDLYTVDVSFDAIANPETRSYFENLPTSFVLPDEAVDRLREVGGQLLRQSPRYHELVRALGGTVPENTEPAAWEQR